MQLSLIHICVKDRLPKPQTEVLAFMRGIMSVSYTHLDVYKRQLWINVCPACHDAIHASGEKQEFYHKLGQYRAMAHYHWTVSDFRRRFYKNYLDITED